MRGRRHPALETALFAAVLLLAAFVGRELWRRLHSGRAVGRERGTETYGEEAPRPNPWNGGPLPPAAGKRPSAAERGVTSVPSLRLTRVEKPGPKPVVVPAPGVD